MEWPSDPQDPAQTPYVPPLSRLQQPPLVGAEDAGVSMTEAPVQSSLYPTTPPLGGGPLASTPIPTPVQEEVPSAKRYRRWPKVLGFATVLLLIAGGVFGGWMLGRTNDTPTLQAEPTLTPVAADDGELPSLDGDAASVDDSSGPVSNDADEPIVAVARAVLPSVVGIEIPGVATGSGIVYDAERGLIVTNAHVVQGVDFVNVKLHTNQVLEEVRVIGRDEDRDVALLQVPGGVELAPVQFASRGTVEVGELAIAVGSPFGLDQTVTAGIVSAVDRVTESFGGARVAMIQTDAPINPGNSGGALVDREGRVIGMNTSIRTGGVNSNGNLGIGFAVPSETIIDIAERILAGEPLGTGFLGIEMLELSNGESGAEVVVVVRDSPAHLGGIAVGDVITTVDGESISTRDDLQATIQLSPPGTLVQIELLRDGDLFALDVVLGAPEPVS